MSSAVKYRSYLFNGIAFIVDHQGIGLAQTWETLSPSYTEYPTVVSSPLLTNKNVFESDLCSGSITFIEALSSTISNVSPELMLGEVVASARVPDSRVDLELKPMSF